MMSYLQFFVSCNGATPFLFMLFLPLGKAYQDGFRMAHDPIVRAIMSDPWEILNGRTQESIKRFRLRWLLWTIILLICQAIYFLLLSRQIHNEFNMVLYSYLFSFLCFEIAAIPIIAILYFLFAPYLKKMWLLLFVSLVIYHPFGLSLPLVFTYFMEFIVIKLGIVEFRQIDARVDHNIILEGTIICASALIVSSVILLLCHFIGKWHRRDYQWFRFAAS